VTERNDFSQKNRAAKIPAAKAAEINEKLQSLDRLAAESDAVAEEMQLLVQELKQPMQIRAHLFFSLEKNMQYIQDILGTDIKLVSATYPLEQFSVGVAYIESLSDHEVINNQIIGPLVAAKLAPGTNLADIPRQLQFKIISTAGIQKTTSMDQILESLLNGDTVLFIDGLNNALIIASRKVETRAIERPQFEGTVLADLESFTENIETNGSMIIKRLPNSSLRFENFTKGSLSRTKIQLIWLEGIANPTVVKEARRRLEAINIDSIDGAGTLGQLIEDSPYSIFPKYRQTERPDLAARSLIEGRFVILCDISPFAIVAPISLWDNLKTMDDYGERSTSASYLRFVRYIAFLMSILLSPIYLSFVTYNHTIVPQSLAVAIATGRAGVPFPSVVELLLMTLAITVIREAAMRIPGSVGYFVGTLAAVVIGQATVAAGYVSASIIIVVATSEISAFAISTSNLVYATRLINYFFIILAGMFGMFGLINGIAIIFWHIASLESFGVPYIYPLVPFELSAMRDTFVRIGVLQKRFKIFAPFNRLRSKRN